MSTRGAIVRLTNGALGAAEFKGVYHHWDSYPTGLGRTLWHLFQEHFKFDLDAMLKTLIDDHPAGWSTIVGADFMQVPGCGYPEGSTQEQIDKWREKPHPQCYCHGARSEEAWEVTEKNASASGVEWVYAFSPGEGGGSPMMTIFSSYCADGSKMIGMFGMGDEKASWRRVAEIALLQLPEPDWAAIENPGGGEEEA